MLRFYLRLVIVALASLSATLLLLRTQPYDDHELRAVLLPDGCPALCFMGIQPGVTTVDEALAILEASGWIDHIYGRTIYISWRWNGKQPQFIDVSKRPYLNTFKPDDGDEIVNEMTIPTQLSTGFIALMIKEPASFIITSIFWQSQDSLKLGSVMLRYKDLYITEDVVCPLALYNVWSSQATITFFARQNTSYYPESRYSDNKLFASALKGKSICS